ncbi:Fur family transcriptional regulator [Jatrophihabitans telluris]|uniref:Fur family transcriptional regulator n=1 Tax=Jatrophihabitans telluris TaxID=2038343 RepID=UPI0024BF4970|nr:transcriptional repressor [Jatrophihabitans telluris]
MSATLGRTLGSKRQRATRQGGLVLEQLGARDDFRSAQAVFSELRARGEDVGLSTVYRHLQTLASDGAADTLQTPDGEALYRLCGQSARSHHHHLVCRDCGRTVEIEGRGVERWAASVAEEHGFIDVDHTVELLGVCADCAGHPSEERDGRP